MEEQMFSEKKKFLVVQAFLVVCVFDLLSQNHEQGDQSMYNVAVLLHNLFSLFYQ